MKNSHGLSVLLIAILLLPLLLPHASAASLQNFEIHLVGEKAMQDSANRYRVVAGVWHEADVYLDSIASSVDIEMWIGNGERNRSNYYHWRYENGVWSDLEYGIYINPEKCKEAGSFYSFYIGIDGDVDYGIWNLSISADGEALYNSQISVEKVVAGYAILPHLVDNAIWVEPFKPISLNLTDDSHAIIIENQGNYPFSVSMNFSALEDNIDVVEKKNTVHIGETIDRHLSIDLPALSPRIIDIKISVHMTPLYRIPTSSTAALLTEQEYETSMSIYVGHSGFHIIQADGFTIQKKDSLNVNYNDVINLTAFLSGNGSATVYLDSLNCSIEKVFLDGKPVSSPIDIDLEEDKEYNISLVIKADVPDVAAKLIYKIHHGENDRTFSTVLNVGPAPPPKPVPESHSGRTFAAMFILGAAIIATAYIFISQKKAAERSRRDEGKKKKDRKRGRKRN